MPGRDPKSRPGKGELVIGVGSRAYVHWAPPAASPTQGVPIVDGTGRMLANDLADGQEVEILAWRPGSREGLSYQVRRTGDGKEWWIAATYLRRAPVRPAAEHAPHPGGAQRP
jgi:hypothetical protein